MILSKSLRRLSLFATLGRDELEAVASKAADVRLGPGEWLVREGERADFFVVLQGTLQLKKEIMGREVSLSELGTGEFFGEISALFGLPTTSSLRAGTRCRIARFEAQEVQRWFQEPGECGRILRSTVKTRLDGSSDHAMSLPTPRVTISGDYRGAGREALLTFLRLNRISYALSDGEACGDGRDRLRAGTVAPVLVDEVRVEHPTPRAVAEALGVATRPTSADYDVVVIGGGPAGLAAAVYGASEGLRMLLVERKAMGGQAGTSSRIENYLGFPNGVSGDELSERAVKQAKRLGAELIVTREVQAVSRDEDGRYGVELDGGESVRCKAMIVTTGVVWRTLTAKGVARLTGKGVFYGAGSLEPAEVTGKRVFLVGGGNSAGQSALFLSHYAQSVTLLVRGSTLTTTMSQYLIEQIAGRANVKVETMTELAAVSGVDRLKRVRTVCRGEKVVERPADVLQVMIGSNAMTDWLPATLQRDPHGFICTGSEVTDLSLWGGERRPLLLETSFPGLFCAGDVRCGSVKRVSSAVGEGSVVISMVHQFLAQKAKL